MVKNKCEVSFKRKKKSIREEERKKEGGKDVVAEREIML